MSLSKYKKKKTNTKRRCRNVKPVNLYFENLGWENSDAQPVTRVVVSRLRPTDAAAGAGSDPPARRQPHRPGRHRAPKETQDGLTRVLQRRSGGTGHSHAHTPTHTQSYTQSHTQSHTQRTQVALSLTHLLARSLTHSDTHSLSHSLTHSLTLLYI